MTTLDALELAWMMIQQAASGKDLCSPWCNGIHEQGCCEGVYQANRASDEIEKVLRENGRLEGVTRC